MPWYFPWSEGIKKRSCRYLLQRYLGQFLEEKLTLDQLTVDLYNGIGSVSDVTLDVQALNELGEQQNLPVEFVDGFISQISVSIPWSSLLNDSSCVEIHGLNLVVQPKQRLDNGASMFESMWSSMTSSMQLAEECLKQSSEQASNEPMNPVNGVEEFAMTIDSILARVKLKFVNTVIRLEHLPKDRPAGGAIELHINLFSYYDEISNEIHDDTFKKPASAFSVKMFSIEGIEFFTNEFSASNRTISRSLLESTLSLDEDNHETFGKKKIINGEDILFGKLLGRQEIQLKIKQKENAAGPKIDVEVRLSTFASLLSPRQLRIVCEVIYGLMSPHLQDTSNVVARSRCHQRPMTTSDFERVEQELTHHISPSNLNNFVSKSLQNTAGWSSAGIDEESDDDFQPVKAQGTSLTSSIANSVSSSYTSSGSYHSSSKFSEHLGYQQIRSHCCRHREKRGNSEADFSGDTNKFELSLNFLAVVLLHRDILTSLTDSPPTDMSIKEMRRVSKEFFTYFMSLNVNNFSRFDGSCNIQSTNVVALQRNHFRLHCAKVISKGDEKSNLSNSEINVTLSLASAELLECLMELKNKAEFVEIIQFCNKNSNDLFAVSRPDVMVVFKYANKSKRFAARNRTDLNVILGRCRSEIDVTIIDRLSHILNNTSILWSSLDKSPDKGKPSLSDVHTPAIDSKFEWKIASPFILAKLRFPIPYLKNNFVIEDCWLKREVHDDILFVELSEVSCLGVMLSHQLAQSFDLQCKQARVLFQETNADKPIPFVLCGVDDKCDMSLPNGGAGFGWPRVVVRLYPKVRYIELEDEEIVLDKSEYMAQSIMKTRKQEPSPFAAKMIKRESDTSHSKYDSEEIILPGSKEEIGEFIEGASHNALLQLDITLPTVVIQIPSKHFYEVIYNRFNTDLMLWVPKSMNNDAFNSSDTFSSHNVNLNVSSGSLFASFSMCKSAARIGSDSEDDELNDNSFYDSDKPIPSKLKKVSGQQQSKITVSIFAAQGVLDILPHARDSSSKVIPGQYGQIQLMLHETNLFCVSGYKANPLLNYVCLQINHCSLYHCSLIPGGTDTSIKPMDVYPSKYMLPTIYKTPPGALINENYIPVGVGSRNGDDMLTLAVRVQGQENRLKSICVANSLNGATIRHRMKTPYTSWLSQLIDFFDVIDYPISHYQPWKVITQLHQQLLNCCVVYKPLYLPYNAALTVENFNISSNITTKTTTSILRFIAEEASLFVSCSGSDEKDSPDILSIDLRKDYICVVDVGLFELSLRLTDNGEGVPQTDLRASNNAVHIRTCVDSTIVLMDLIKYIASDGDLLDLNAKDEYPMKRSHESNTDVLVNLQGENLIEDDTPRMSSGHVLGFADGVPDLVEEAINDVVQPFTKRRGGCHKRRNDTHKSEVFYFPDENLSELFSSVAFSGSSSSEEDLDTFFFVDKESGMGYTGSNILPEVRLLTKEPIKMVDNYFTVPIHKVDVLKAPKGYPNPISKYTLREMTIVWHMYGGHDFPKKDAESEKTETKKQVTIVSDKYSSSESLSSFGSSKKLSMDSVNISYSAKKSPDIQSVNFIMNNRASPRLSFDRGSDSPSVLYDRQKSTSWQALGGVNRQHEQLMELKLTKLKYQYEIYPKSTKQASRHVLIVQEIELSDRMATSQINKFLYLYSSIARPKQSHANMLVIKATNIRPELKVEQRQECCVRVSLLPLRLNIDQDSLLFLINFFVEISGNKNDGQSSIKSTTVVKHSTSSSSSLTEPVMNIENVNAGPSSSVTLDSDDERPTPASQTTNNTPVFIRSFIFSPEVPIRLDYEGKRVDMSHGPLAGLIMGLGQLNCSELKLKKICNRHGFLGLEKLISYVLSEWFQDIKKNQLKNILGGVGPMHSLVQLIQGIRDLFWLPIEQYQKDGRFVRGLRKGANSFTTSTAIAALELTARLVYAIQRIAETAFDLVSPGPSIRQLRYYERTGKNDPRKNRHRKYNPAADIRQGVASALQLVKEGFEETAQTLIRVASVENEVKGTVGAVGGVMREMPSTTLMPIILATQATGNVLDGVRCHLVPDAKTEAALKWKHDYFS